MSDAASLGPHTAVAVVGTGSMGAGIAQVAALAGHAVRLFDAHPGAADAALQRIGNDLSHAVQRGRLQPADRAAVLERLSVASSIAGLDGCGLVVEAVAEKLDTKQALFRQLEQLLPADVVLATNTSSISITAVAQGMVHPGRVVGWHFFNPATRMRLVEVVRGLETDHAVADALHALSRAWGKTPVDAPNTPGFIVNRISRPLYGESLRLLAEGLAPAPVIDRLLREAGGFPMGPFELIDLIGVDVNLAVTESVFAATHADARYAPHLIQQELVRAGRLGRKSGRGFYDYQLDAAMPTAAAVEPAPLLPAMRVSPQPGLLGPLIERLRAGGLVVVADGSLPTESFAIDEVAVALSDGRTATERGAGGPLLLLDLARDFATTRVLGATASVGHHERLPTLAAALQPAGVQLLALDDVAGLGVLRVACCFVNEAADLCLWTGTLAADIDIAVVLGAGHPQGPLAWGDTLGVDRVVEVLRHLQAHYGDTRYRCSPRLLRAHHAGLPLHG
ncbi:3-hydroxyacyl-CoA dehydrogenase [Aquincola sp. MAHUQ-54]|uniref:3-hydroxyacyl-CoA dehydrogenase n=1 Tax=Aquincola agrisoli TaxID=3119538 RepID=A0AAW9Q1Y9_9BURK